MSRPSAKIGHLKVQNPRNLRCCRGSGTDCAGSQAGRSHACKRNISSYGQTEGRPRGPGLDRSFTGVTQPSAQDHGPVFDRQTRSGPSDQRGVDRAARGIRPARCSRKVGRQSRRRRKVRSCRRSRSSHRLGFDVQQVLQLTGRSVSSIQAVRDHRDALVQQQSQALGGQLGQSQVESRRRQALNLRGQSGHRPFEARVGSRHRSQVACGHGTEAKATVAAAENRGMQSQTVASAQQRLKHSPRKLRCESTSRSPGPAAAAGSDQRDRPPT